VEAAKDEQMQMMRRLALEGCREPLVVWTIIRSFAAPEPPPGRYVCRRADDSGRVL
jgi:hypothetical protein